MAKATRSSGTAGFVQAIFAPSRRAHAMSQAEDLPAEDSATESARGRDPRAPLIRSEPSGYRFGVRPALLSFGLSLPQADLPAMPCLPQALACALVQAAAQAWASPVLQSLAQFSA